MKNRISSYSCAFVSDVVVVVVVVVAVVVVVDVVVVVVVVDVVVDVVVVVVGAPGWQFTDPSHLPREQVNTFSPTA